MQPRERHILINLTLYSRSYCHLCDDMLDALTQLVDGCDCKISVIDVDASESLVALYDELVPVLTGERNGAEEQLCHYFLDKAKVQSFINTLS